MGWGCPGPGVTLTGTVHVLLPQVDQEEETISLQNAVSVVELNPSTAPALRPSSGGPPGSSLSCPPTTPTADPQP